MWQSYVFYLCCAVLLTVSEGVKVQHNFYYPLPPNRPRYDNDKIGYRIGTVSFTQPIAVRFPNTGNYKTIGDHCNTNRFNGVCTFASKCPDILRDIQNGKNPVVCSYQTTEVIVCCPQRNNRQNPQVNEQSKTINTNFDQSYQSEDNPNQRRFVADRTSGVRQSKRKCEEYSILAARSSSFTSLSIIASTQKISIPTCAHSTGLIVGGDIAKTGEFPHMAAVGWTSLGKTDWKCGGSLISEYFVLTAAHCSSVYGIPPNIIRLGDQNLVRQDDKAQPEDYQVESVILHPNYRHSSHYYDIALLRMDRQVTFTRFIRPACLWDNSSLNITKAVATGWGQLAFAGDRSDDLRKVALSIIDNNHCQQLYEKSKKLRRGITKSQLCAGHLEGGKDTCQGDSGGPIQVITPRNHCVFYIIGVTSFGKACASVNTAAVYTRVSSFVNWIESNVWP